MARRGTMKGHSSKTCRKCETTRPLEDFNYTDKKHASRRAICRDCERRYKQNPKYLTDQREYAKYRRRNQPDVRLREQQNARLYGATVEGRAKRLFLAARHRANTSGTKFTLIIEMISFALLVGKCQRTGIPFDLSAPKAGMNFNPFAPSVDKKNPFEGYTNENVQIVCNAYNLAKHQMTDEQFIEFCRVVVDHNK